MININKINGTRIINLLNNAENIIEDYDELYGWHFFFDEQKIENDKYILFFDIEYGHYIKENTITISSDGTIKISLEEPFDGGGGDDEILQVLNIYIEELQEDNVSEEDLRVELIEKIFDKLNNIKMILPELSIIQLQNMIIKLEK